MTESGAPAAAAPTTAVPVAGPALRRFMRSWPGGVAVVTTAVDGTPSGCTVNAFISVSLQPALVLVSLSVRSRTLAALVASSTFAVNVLAGRQRRLAERFAAPSRDRFAGLDLEWRSGVPLLHGAAAAAVCRVSQVIVAADHALVLAAPAWCRADEAAEPLLFAGGHYHDLSSAARPV